MAAGKSRRRVEQALQALGIDTEVLDMEASTRTAREAADAVGCHVDQIVKSLLFVTDDGSAWLVLASGRHAVDPRRIEEVAGSPVRLADATTVRSVTGFAIGGVAPVGLAHDVPVLVDTTLLTFDRVWAAAGSPHAVFGVAPVDLVAVTGGRPIEVV